MKNNKMVKLDLTQLGLSKNVIDFNFISSMTEELRSIKRVLLSTAFSGEDGTRRLNRVMVTSVNRGEGKSFLSGHIALSVSLEQGKHCLLIDANIQNPSITKCVDSPPEMGLIDFLEGRLPEFSDCVLDTNEERLRIATLGKTHYLANELLSGNRMAQLMVELNTRYDDRLVIIDSPHLHGMNETAAIAQHVDQIIVVVEEGKTKVKDLQAATKNLPENVIIHYLLNKTLDTDTWKTKT
jgi:receptor protein-tyrosine kinase